MTAIIDGVIGLLFLLTLFTGYREGLVKSTSSLISSLLGFFFAGKTYSVMAGVLSFLPGTEWQNFIGFFVVALFFDVVIGLILIPARAWYDRKTEKGFSKNLAGSLIGVINLALGLTVFALAVKVYPLTGLLEEVVNESSVFKELTGNFGFLRLLMSDFV
jgi:uncharacterized membrane protein required for colicin V production